MKSSILLALAFALFRQLAAAQTNTPDASTIPNSSADGLKQDFPTEVTFKTSDAGLQHLFDTAETEEAANVVQFSPTMKVLVEGGGYNSVWIETQPMGGEMYAKRNVQVALNNQIIFLLTQRDNGRFPGMVRRKPPGQLAAVPTDGPAPSLGDFAPWYKSLQGFCFADPAWRMYFWTGKDKAYLQKLYQGLEAYDAYLWRTRDSNGDGVLESWATTDTGEDNSNRYTKRYAPDIWPFDTPPGSPGTPDVQDPKVYAKYFSMEVRKQMPPPTLDQVLVPFDSMDVMGYSYDARATLARISHELNNGKESDWQQKAEEVRKNLIAKLWDPNRHACFDRDKNGAILDEVIHNNLRAMYHGVFTQEMADAFIRYHLLNPVEFWTPMPLPSIAANNPLFHEAKDDWSGEPQGLTYQRAIRALENYGHFAEVTLVGRKLLAALNRAGAHFPEGFGTFTGIPEKKHGDNYGPTILSMLEYCSLMNGVNLDVENGEVWWSGLNDGGENFTYAQRWKDRTWELTLEKGIFTARLNDRIIFSCTSGVRVVTNLDGQVRKVVGIDTTSRQIVLNVSSLARKFTVEPNKVYGADGATLHTVPFDYPYHDQ